MGQVHYLTDDRTPSPADAGLVRCGLMNRLLLAVGGDEGIDQAEQLLLGLRWHAFDESEATFEPRADGGCGGLNNGVRVISPMSFC
jgi:hypothetical protein